MLYLKKKKTNENTAMYLMYSILSKHVFLLGLLAAKVHEVLFFVSVPIIQLFLYFQTITKQPISKRL